MTGEVAVVHTLPPNAATIQQLNATNATIANLDLTNLIFQGRSASWTQTPIVYDLNVTNTLVITSVDFKNQTYTSANITGIRNFYKTSGMWVISG